MERWRIDGARANGITANSLRDKVGSDGLGKADDCGLRCTIDKAIGYTLDRSSHRRHIDDGSTTPLEHSGERSANQAIHGGHVDAHGPIPCVVVAVEDGAGVHVAGAVE